MVVESDLALGHRARRQQRVGSRVTLRTGIASDVRVNAGLEPEGMQPIDQRPEAGLFGSGPRGAGKNAGPHDHAPIGLMALLPPAIVDVDVAVSQIAQTGVDESLRRTKQLRL